MRPIIGCHCETCRRTSGHYWAATRGYRKDLRLLEDRGLKWFASSDVARRGFCQECGSSLLYEEYGSPEVSISGGVIDPPTGMSLAEHIGTAEASDYYGVHDPVPRHAECRISDRWRLPPLES
ncbi:aldehyde-activating protein [Tamilnaduibacter salinus]|nr:aldehyde-activating protein [Tamilnaduibacter salinus]